jgi:hypothetical protein
LLKLISKTFVTHSKLWLLKQIGKASGSGICIVVADPGSKTQFYNNFFVFFTGPTGDRYQALRETVGPGLGHSPHPSTPGLADHQ